MNGKAAAYTVSVEDAAVSDPSGLLSMQARWLMIAMFVLFSSLNYLDRQLLAAVAPAVMSEFQLSNAAYGGLLAAFSTPYMLMAPLSGLFIDRVGLRLGAMIAAGSWSLVGMFTGLTSTVRGLTICRMGLGVAEAAAIPCGSKASATYLPAGEQGLGLAVQTLGFTIGSVAAPLVVAAVAPTYGWRTAFVVCGVGGLLWIPLWALLSRHSAINIRSSNPSVSYGAADVLRDRRIWSILIANALIMTLHSMWMNWTTLYLVQSYGLSQSVANQQFAWLPPIFATAGGLLGAAFTARRCARGANPLRTRLAVCTNLAPFLLLTALIPLAPSPALATAGICASFFICMAMLNNLHVVPIDIFGVRRAALTSGLIVSSYALTQAVLSPMLGAIADIYGFGILCVAVSILPSLGAVTIRATLLRRGDAAA